MPHFLPCIFKEHLSKAEKTARNIIAIDWSNPSVLRKGCDSTLFTIWALILLCRENSCLTNTYFDGQSRGNAFAANGHSKEKRSDCPLVALGLVLDSIAISELKVLAVHGNTLDVLGLDILDGTPILDIKKKIGR